MLPVQVVAMSDASFKLVHNPGWSNEYSQSCISFFHRTAAMHI